ncbi:MAG: lipoyl(octanoyl) transferase LipB [Desulfovibrionaceae bacterium]|nr:lipoyl(octanoyl) transferase LipB [Desulfovibrionaceae bacterium]
MIVEDLGLIRYADAVAVQERRVAEVADGAENTLFLLEHAPVITLGRNAGDQHLHASPEFLASRGIDLVRSARGGDITCHFPGQLVAYPVFRIAGRPGGLHGFFHDLEEVVIVSLAEVGVTAGRWEGRPGVWIGTRKIASIGIAVRKWTTWHGLALNVGANLDLFSLITLCGLGDAEPTSVHRELGRDDPSMGEMKDVLTRNFRRIFA